MFIGRRDNFFNKTATKRRVTAKKKGFSREDAQETQKER
jgi:hypothetical protein